MNDELKTECMELCVTACEKFSQNNEVCKERHQIRDLESVFVYSRVRQEWSRKQWLVDRDFSHVKMNIFEIYVG